MSDTIQSCGFESGSFQLKIRSKTFINYGRSHLKHVLKDHLKLLVLLLLIAVFNFKLFFVSITIFNFKLFCFISGISFFFSSSRTSSVIDWTVLTKRQFSFRHILFSVSYFHFHYSLLKLKMHFVKSLLF